MSHHLCLCVKSGFRSLILATVLSLLWGIPAFAKGGPDSALPAATGAIPVYVGDWQVSPDIRLSGRALEVALCVHLMKDKRVEGQCAGDIEEVLKFSADSALAGNQTPAVERLVKRLQMSRWLLLGEVLPLPGGKWRVLLQAFEKDPKSVGVTLLAGARVTAVEMEVGPEEQARVLTLIPGLSDQLLEKLLGAGGLGDMPPPAPVTTPIAPKIR